MRIFFITINLLLGVTGIQAQDIDKIFQKYQQDENVLVMNLPGFVFKLADDKHGEELTKDLMKKIEKVKILVADEANEQLRKALSKDLNQLFQKGNYQQLLKVKSDGDIVDFRFQPSKKKGDGRFILLVNGSDGGLVAVSLKGNFTTDDGLIMAKSMKDDQFNLNF